MVHNVAQRNYNHSFFLLQDNVSKDAPSKQIFNCECLLQICHFLSCRPLSMNHDSISNIILFYFKDTKWNINIAESSSCYSGHLLQFDHLRDWINILTFPVLNVSWSVCTCSDRGLGRRWAFQGGPQTSTSALSSAPPANSTPAGAPGPADWAPQTLGWHGDVGRVTHAHANKYARNTRIQQWLGINHGRLRLQYLKLDVPRNSHEFNETIAWAGPDKYRCQQNVLWVKCIFCFCKRYSTLLSFYFINFDVFNIAWFPVALFHNWPLTNTP